ncbi:MAG: hypothetical protein LBS65_07960 [Desulfovibrio sp.]|nr:hypothetical protein [Desulfovibrio sp.]
MGYFQGIFAEMYSRCVPMAPKHKFRFKLKLYSMDSTVIKLCLTLFPWAKYRSRALPAVSELFSSVKGKML